jgi:AbrB family looped-hinge helix DNA binding protein
MKTSTVSSKFQIAIPKQVREATNLVPGTKVEIIPWKSRIEIVPLSPISDLRGFLEGIDTNLNREDRKL